MTIRRWRNLLLDADAECFRQESLLKGGGECGSRRLRNTFSKFLALLPWSFLLRLPLACALALLTIPLRVVLLQCSFVVLPGVALAAALLLLAIFQPPDPERALGLGLQVLLEGAVLVGDLVGALLAVELRPMPPVAATTLHKLRIVRLGRWIPLL